MIRLEAIVKRESRVKRFVCVIGDIRAVVMNKMKPGAAEWPCIQIQIALSNSVQCGRSGEADLYTLRLGQVAGGL